MIRLIIEQVVGLPSWPNERLFYSSPTDPIDSDLLTLYHDRMLESMLGDMGYDPEPTSEGMAVTYSELADNNFTGLGALFDARMTNICLAYYVVPVTQFSIACGGDWIDQQTAQATGMAVDKVTSTEEDDFQLDFRTDVGSVEGALLVYYEDLLDYVIENIERETDEEDIEKDLDVFVVVTRGISSPEGFEELFEHHLEDSTTPLSVNEVRSIDHPPYSVVRGSSVVACSEEESNGGAFDSELEVEAAPELN